MRRLALLGAAVALVTVVASTAVAPRRELDAARTRLPSAGNPGRRGLGAAAAWLEATGRPFTVRGGEPGQAPPAAGEAPGPPPAPGSAWLLVAPRVALPAEFAAAFLDHAARGGLVLWVLGPVPQPALEAALQVRRAPGGVTPAGAGQPGHPLLGGLLLRGGGEGVLSTHPGARPAAGPGEPGEAVAIAIGRGEVLVLGGPALLENDGLGEADHLSLWVRLSARGPITFDERWLPPTGVAAPSPRLPLLVAGQASLACALLLLALGLRHGAVRPPPATARRTAADYLGSLAALTRRAGAEPALAAASWARLRRRLEGRRGPPAHLPAPEAAARLEAHAPEAAAALRRGEAACARPGPGQLLAVTQAAADVELALTAPRRRP